VLLLIYFLAFSALLCSLSGLLLASMSLSPQHIYRKDFLQEYLLAKAALENINPYLPLSELADHFFGGLPNPVWAHPSPHAPPLAILILPLALLSYPQSAIVWLFFEVFCAALSIYIIFNHLGIRKLRVIKIPLIFVVLFSYSPFVEGFVYGQLHSPILLLLMTAWLALRRNYSEIGGILIGTALTIKFMGWPILVFLGITKKWSAVFSAVSAILLIYAVTGVVIGFDSILYYYREVGSTVESLFRAAPGNLSVWSLGWRLFEGIYCPVLAGISAPPLIAAPNLAPIASMVLLGVFVACGIVLAGRAHQIDIAFGVLACVSVLANPIAWSFYLVMLLIPVSIAAKQLSIRKWPTKKSAVLVVIVLILFVPHYTLMKFISMFTISPPELSQATVSFWVGLLTLLPMVLTVGLMFLVYSISKSSNSDGL
jgi:hypothetical protein